MESTRRSGALRGSVICSAKLSHFGMVTDEMRFINEQQLRRMSFLPLQEAHLTDLYYGDFTIDYCLLAACKVRRKHGRDWRRRLR